MENNLKRNWDSGQVDLTATSTAYLIETLYGGESITIKAHAGNSGIVYIGSDKLVSTTNGFQLSANDSVSLTLPLTFGAKKYIEIYGVCATAGDDVSYIKLIDVEPETSGG